MATVGDETAAAGFRAEIDRLLASPEFASSRQLQDFLRFTSEKALSGAVHLDQSEIAAAVLSRPDFDPVQDATVRKLATLTRQRLEQYYARTGAPPDGAVTLPLRSYLPRYDAEPSSKPETVPVPPLRPFPWRWVAGVSLAGTVLMAGYWGIRTRSATTGRTTSVATERGDLENRGADVAPGAVRLGPPLRSSDEVVARLSFTPSAEAQQAGIAVWQGPDDYVRLGRRFQGRNQIEFAVESHGAITARHMAFDPEGQSGAPVWLALRREDNVYRAFFSADGLHWEPWGEAVSPAHPFAAPRAALYAYHGRRDASSALAVFDAAATGATFGLPGVDPAAPLTLAGTSRDILELRARPAVLSIFFEPPRPNASAELTRPLTSRDWEVETRLDFLPRPGTSAGLAVAGTKGSIRLARYYLNGPAVTLIHDGVSLTGDPDLPGSPPLTLRLRCLNGEIRGSWSADGKRWHEISQRLSASVLSGTLRAGIRVGNTTLDPENLPAAARFYYFRENIASLAPFR